VTYGSFRPKVAATPLAAFHPIADINGYWNVGFVKQSVRAAVALGTLAGGLPLMMLTLPLAIGDYIDPISGQRSLFGAIYLAGLPVWISFGVVLVSSIFVGLPVHFALQKKRVATHTSYVAAGALTGFLVTLIFLLAIGAVAGFWMVILGAFSGGVTSFYPIAALCRGSWVAALVAAFHPKLPLENPVLQPPA
jgi:hypothetical protein